VIDARVVVDLDDDPAATRRFESTPYRLSPIRLAARTATSRHSAGTSSTGTVAERP